MKRSLIILLMLMLCSRNVFTMELFQTTVSEIPSDWSAVNAPAGLSV